LLAILEAMEGQTRLNLCLADGSSCSRKTFCPAHPVWQEAQAALESVLRRTSLEELAQAALERVLQRASQEGLAQAAAPGEVPGDAGMQGKSA
jgi:DNA-binding IscR family transcriptional regulator